LWIELVILGSLQRESLQSSIGLVDLHVTLEIRTVAGDEPVVPDRVGRHWARAGWVVVIDEGVQPELDLSKLGGAVADIQNAAAGLEAAEAQLEQAAGPVPQQPRGGRPRSAGSK
jgi:hypothetical protein